MVIAVTFVAVLTAVATLVVVLWGVFEALVRFGRFLWRLLVPVATPAGNLLIVRKAHEGKMR